MPIDFAALVIQPCLDTFGRAVQYRPLVSQPGAAPFEILAIFDNEYLAVPAGEAFVSQSVPQVGVRLSHFPVEPAPGDEVLLAAYEAQRTKATGEAWALGQTLYLDGSARATTSPGAQNPRLGTAAADALAGDTTGLVRIERLYPVIEVKPDGQGHAKLMLRETLE